MLCPFQLIIYHQLFFLTSQPIIHQCFYCFCRANQLTGFSVMGIFVLNRLMVLFLAWLAHLQALMNLLDVTGSFYTPWKHQKISAFLTFSGRKEKDHMKWVNFSYEKWFFINYFTLLDGISQKCYQGLL